MFKEKKLFINIDLPIVLNMIDSHEQTYVYCYKNDTNNRISFVIVDK